MSDDIIMDFKILTAKSAALNLIQSHIAVYLHKIGNKITSDCSELQSKLVDSLINTTENDFIITIPVPNSNTLWKLENYHNDSSCGYHKPIFKICRSLLSKPSGGRVVDCEVEFQFSIDDIKDGILDRIWSGMVENSDTSKPQLYFEPFVYDKMAHLDFLGQSSFETTPKLLDMAIEI